MKTRAAGVGESGGLWRRSLQVARVAVRYLLWPRLRGRGGGAQRLREALEELGGTWVKLGQALALRFDLLPADYCLQLFQLLNQVRPFPADQVRTVLERELGKPVETLFRTFDWDPVAAASIGQVHRAELPDGTPVAVKVQRPGISSLVRSDLKLMRQLALLIDAWPSFRHARARDLVREFARWTEEELDYRIEARHASVLRRNAADDPFERNPRVFPAYTTSRVLTLEYLAGISVIDIVAALRRGDSAFLERLAAEGHDTRRIASHIVWNALNQIYRFGFFHADPHPANLIVLDGDSIGYVDFGIVGKLDGETTDSLRYFAQSLFAGHAGRAIDEFLQFLTPSRRTDLAAARRDLMEAMKSYVESARVSPQELVHSEEIFEIEMLSLVRKHRMALSPDAARYLKAVLTAEATVKELDPDFDLAEHENRFFGRLMLLETRESLSPRRIAQWLLDARFRVRNVLSSLEGLRSAPGHVVSVARDVRRRVQTISLLAILGWGTVLAMTWAGGGEILGFSFRSIALVGAAVSLLLLIFSLREVRRLPSESDAPRIGQYPRRLR